MGATMPAMLSNPSSKVEIRPNPGPQFDAFASSADILIYGGSAGGGKSFYLLTEPTRHYQRKGFRGGIFRRTYPQIKGQGGLWDEAQAIYRGLGARMREGQELDATFPIGASIQFSHLQHEKTKYEYQGHQFAYLGFDELTHFSETQFFYMLSRLRTTCGIKPYVRCTCNPDPSSWVAEFIAWWIDQDSGFPIPERAGQVRYFTRADVGHGEQIIWADSKQAIIDQFPHLDENGVMSATFIPASLDDNPKLLEKDPGYRARLESQPRVERERLLKGNWKVQEGSIIDPAWMRTYYADNANYTVNHARETLIIPRASCRRFATIDTAGTSKERAAELRGDPPSHSVCAIWDYWQQRDMLLLVHVWRGQVDWNDLKERIPSVLAAWQVPRAYIENAHYGQPLSKEIKGCATELIGPVIPGMDDGSRGAKLERAIASGMLSRWEDGTLRIPNDMPDWFAAYRRELTVWTGLPKETADQIDVTSYASFVSRKARNSWGGVIQVGNRTR